MRESGSRRHCLCSWRTDGWEGWEDSAVRPENSAPICANYSLSSRLRLSHPDLRPLRPGLRSHAFQFELETDEGIAKYLQFIDEAADIVLAHGGSLSGEHGDGQSRAALLPKMFGPELVQAFREFKPLWDPPIRMNPGKLADPIAVYGPQ